MCEFSKYKRLFSHFVMNALAKKRCKSFIIIILFCIFSETLFPWDNPVVRHLQQCHDKDGEQRYESSSPGQPNGPRNLKRRICVERKFGEVLDGLHGRKRREILPEVCFRICQCVASSSLSQLGTSGDVIPTTWTTFWEDNQQVRMKTPSKLAKLSSVIKWAFKRPRNNETSKNKGTLYDPKLLF